MIGRSIAAGAAVLLALVGTGCGGGDEGGASGGGAAAAAAASQALPSAAAAAAASAPAPTATPAATVARLRAKALALAEAAVSPEEAARQLMDFAQVHYAVYFPSHPATQSFPPFLYRYYPATGIYLGVVVTAGMGYAENGVYVMGGDFGNEPLFVGPLSAFITPVAPPPALAVVINKTGVFFPGAGHSTRLSAQTLDANGQSLPANASWSSTAPDKVSIDAAGLLTAHGVGSAQVFAQVGSVRSAPTLVVVAVPKPGALLVSDAQVLAVGAFLPPAGAASAAAAGGVGTRYEVLLQGVAAPALGTVVLAAETALVAGKVLATRQDAAGLAVTLALAPLPELFSDYDIRWNIALSAFPLEAVPLRGAAGLRRSALAAPAKTATAATAATAAAPPRRRLDALEPFKAIDCEASLKPEFIDAKVQLAPQIDLNLVVENLPGHSKQVLEGTATLSGSVKLTLQAGFEAKGKCEAAKQFKIPAFGWVSLIVMPAVRFGVGVALEGKLHLVQGELGVEGKVGLAAALGWECGGATPECRGLDAVTPINEFKSRSKMPSVNDMQVKIEGQFYVLAGLDLSLFAGLGNAKVIEARVGPKQSFDLGFEDDQAARRDYAASYDLKLEAVVEPGDALQAAIEKVIGDTSTSVKFKAGLVKDLSESPKGRLSVSQPRVAVGAPVDFQVVIDPKTADYHLLGYNITGIELYRKREGEDEFKAWKSMPMLASQQTTFNYQWRTEAADVGKHEFAAFVNTQLLTPLLEIAPDSIQKVEVLCFSAGAMGAARAAAQAAPRRRAQAAAAAGTATSVDALAPRRSAVNTCEDAWVGTVNFVAKTPSLPTDNITTRTNITWTYDAEQSGPFGTYYKATAGSVDVAFNSSNGCTYALSPRTFAITPDAVMPSRLAIFNHPFLGPPSYAFGAQQLINTTVTASCPGTADVVTQMNGFLLQYASGSGPYSPGQLTLVGSTEDAATTASWEFTHR